MAHGGLTPLASQQWPRSVTRPGSWVQALVGPLQGCFSQPGFKKPARPGPSKARGGGAWPLGGRPSREE